MCITAQTQRFNVSGTAFEVLKATLVKAPSTLLGKLASEANGEQVFIDQDAERFRYILDYYRHGEVILPASIPREAFMRDVEYYQLPKNCVTAVERGASKPLPTEALRRVLTAKNPPRAMAPCGECTYNALPARPMGFAIW